MPYVVTETENLKHGKSWISIATMEYRTTTFFWGIELLLLMHVDDVPAEIRNQ